MGIMNESAADIKFILDSDAEHRSAKVDELKESSQKDKEWKEGLASNSESIVSPFSV